MHVRGKIMKGKDQAKTEQGTCTSTSNDNKIINNFYMTTKYMCIDENNAATDDKDMTVIIK